LNICSILSVTKKPPTTLTIAKITAIKPRITDKLVFLSPAARIAPITEMPEMAFEPDIKGVCKVGGTLLMTSKPMKEAKTSTNKAASNASVMMNFGLRNKAHAKAQRRKEKIYKTQEKSLSNSLFLVSFASLWFIFLN